MSSLFERMMPGTPAGAADEADAALGQFSARIAQAARRPGPVTVGECHVYFDNDPPFRAASLVRQRQSDRPPFDDIWLTVAKTVALRGTCTRLKVGAVIVDDNQRIISTGYNGAPAGEPHCTEVGCLIEPETGRCKRTVHAEMNALIQCGIRASGSTLYVTHEPCESCIAVIRNAGILRVAYLHSYTSASVRPPDSGRVIMSRCDDPEVTL